MFDRQTLSRAALVLAVGISSAAPGMAANEGSPFGDRAFASLPARAGGAMELPLPRHFRALEVDGASLRASLALAPAERSGGVPVVFAIPYPDGTDRLFHVVESSIMEPGLQAKFPEIRTYAGQGLDDPTATVRLSMTPLGFHAMVLSATGTVYVDPYRRWDSRYVLSFYKKDARRAAGKPFHCDVHGDQLAADLAESLPPVTSAASGTNLRTYRLALAATGEYSTAVCAPNPAAVACAMAAMVVSMNRVDGIYEREVAIRMVLIANDNLIVYTDGTTDPYTNGNGSTMLGQNQTNINSVIGTANYDIGHVFSTGGGGVAQLQVPCTSSKAKGVTGNSSPIGDGFDVDYVAHEMGHQFGGNHTFNGTTSNCGGGNRSAGAAYEPGSGTTIMAYAGICGAEDLQPHSDDTFHSKSFDEIVAFSTGATGSSCAVTTATGNTAPTANGGAAFIIPKQTPFILTGSGDDGDSDALTYMWEEFDLGTAAPPNDDVAAARPIFRSFVPLTIPSRTFPRLSDILNNVSTIGESMSTRNRTMTFRLTVRDNRTGGGGVNYASTTVTVNATAGPFAVTQPNTALSWAANSTQTVTWDVAGTTVAPISCANVAIDLSADGGNTFPNALAASTPNDGSEAVTVPNIQGSSARVRVSCVGNIFFDISNANFTITAPSALPPPSLLSLLPISGTIAGGTSVALTGTDFVNGATVLFGASAATSVTFNSGTSLTVSTPAHAAGTVSVTVTNPDTQTSTLNSAYTYDASGFFALTPCRIVDTRNANGPTGGPALSGGVPRDFPIAGNCGVPAQAFAVALNITVVSPTAGGGVRVYQTGITTPMISSLSFNSGQTRANNGVIGVNGPTAGSVTVLPDIPGGQAAHLVVDIMGYFR
ncbi:MAG: zinc-dependent metalloprotease family protein [Acidobacteriota bacterium]